MGIAGSFMSTADMFPESVIRMVVSASRRTDMVASDPTGLATTLAEKAPIESTHTVVLWTKNPQNIFECPALMAQLKLYDQLFLHLSITGLGGSAMINNPVWSKSPPVQRRCR